MKPECILFWGGGIFGCAHSLLQTLCLGVTFWQGQETICDVRYQNRLGACKVSLVFVLAFLAKQDLYLSDFLFYLNSTR